MTDKEAMKLALEALELLTSAWQTFDALDYGDNAIAALKERLAQPEQEPVAWMSEHDVGFRKSEFGATPTVPLYTTPPQRPWVGLTDGERYRWLRKEYAESRETYLAECVPSENALDEYIDRQMAKTSIKTERWSGK